MADVVSVNVAEFIGLLIAVAVVAAAVRFVRVPYTIALVLTGLALALAPRTPHLELTPGVILTVFLPVLLFYAAYNLDLGEVRANLRPVALLAVPGVFLTAGLVGSALHLAAGLDWSAALLFGTIVAATDPVAVLAIFGEVGAPRRLATIINAESIFNDGTALVLFTTVLSVALTRTFDAATTGEQFVIAVAGSLALGSAVGVVGSTILSRIDEALLEMTITLIMAYGGFLLADRLGISGPLETATAGLVLGAQGRRVMSPATRLQARATWEFLDFLANSLLFLLMGLALRPIGEQTILSLGGLWKPLVVSIVAMTAARALVIFLVGHLLARAGQHLPRGWRAVLTWVGLRGAVSLAAGLSLPAALPQRNLLLALTFGVVLWTLLVQGLTIKPLLARLGLGAEAASHLDIELTLGRLRAVEAAEHDLTVLGREDGVDAQFAQRLAGRYRERSQTLRAELATQSGSSPGQGQQGERALERHLLHVQRAAVGAAYTRGLLSGAARRALLAELDRDLAMLEPDRDEE